MRIGSQTARTGTECFLSIYEWKGSVNSRLGRKGNEKGVGHTKENHAGSPPSRDHAHVNRDVEAILAKFMASEITSSPHTIAVVALTDPVACLQISIMGKLEFKALSKRPMVNRTVMTIAYARTPLMATV